MEIVFQIKEVLLWGVLVIAAFTDWKNGSIYNWLTLPAIVVGVVLSTIAAGWAGLFASVAALLLGAVFFLPGFCCGQMGGGDVKLMAAVGAIGGLGFVAKVAVVSIFVGGIVGLVIILIRGGVLSAVKWYCQVVKVFFLRLLYKGSGFAYPKIPVTATFPFALAILCAAVLVTWAGDRVWLFS